MEKPIPKAAIDEDLSHCLLLCPYAIYKTLICMKRYN